MRRLNYQYFWQQKVRVKELGKYSVRSSVEIPCVFHHADKILIVVDRRAETAVIVNEIILRHLPTSTNNINNQSINQIKAHFVKRHKSRANRRRVKRKARPSGYRHYLSRVFCPHIREFALILQTGLLSFFVGSCKSPQPRSRYRFLGSTP